jgi:hypothetical protein
MTRLSPIWSFICRVSIALESLAALLEESLDLLEEAGNLAVVESLLMLASAHICDLLC